MWEADELAVLLGPFVLFFAIKKPFIGLIIGVLALKFYTKVKYTRQAGYIQHFFIKKGVLSLKELPAGYKLYL
jgi:type IV conjugative transfer system protein TraL